MSVALLLQTLATSFAQDDTSERSAVTHATTFEDRALRVPADGRAERVPEPRSSESSTYRPRARPMDHDCTDWRHGVPRNGDLPEQDS